MKPPAANFIESLLALNASGQAPLLLVKFVIMFGLSIYFVFALIIIRQISLMTSTIKTPITGTLKLIGYIHMLLSIAVWFIAFSLL